jgi:hypothetical protein
VVDAYYTTIETQRHRDLGARDPKIDGQTKPPLPRQAPLIIVIDLRLDSPDETGTRSIQMPAIDLQSIY